MTVDSALDGGLGPLDILVIGFPDGKPDPVGFDRLAALVDAGTIRILDLEFVLRDDGVAYLAKATDLPPVDGFDADFWAGASSHLLDRDDLDHLAADLEEGELGLVVLIEQSWMLGLIDEWVGNGAHLIADDGLPSRDLVDALDAAERREGSD